MRARGRAAVSGTLLAVGLLVVATPGARALSPFELPWADVAPAVVTAQGVLRAAAVGMPDERLDRMGAVRSSARQRARARALGMLHRFVDDALARVHAEPAVATAVHGAVDRAAHVTAVRPLADGSAVAVVDVPLGALRAAASLGGLPWSP